MSAKPPAISLLIAEFLQREPPEPLSQPALDELSRFIATRRGSTPSDAWLVERLIDAGATVERALGGIPPDLAAIVRTRSRADAEASLLEMASLYAQAVASNDGIRRADCRRAVIRGKERLQQALRRRDLSQLKREEKLELLTWYQSWLENPGLFADWLELRKHASENEKPSPSGAAGRP